MLQLWGLFHAFVGVVVYRANKLRPANRVFSLVVFVGALWTVNYGFILEGGPGAVLHMRLGAAVASFLPAIAMMVRGAILRPRARVGELAAEARPLFVIGIGLCGVTALDWFVETGFSPPRPLYHFGWQVLHTALAALMFFEAWQGWRALPSLPAPRRSELLVTGVIHSLCVGVISVVLGWNGHMNGLPPQWLEAIIVGYILGLTWTIAGRQIFDARVLLLIGLHALVAIAATACFFLAAQIFLEKMGHRDDWTPKVVACLAASVFGLLITREFFHRYSALVNRDTGPFQKRVAAALRDAKNCDMAMANVEQLFSEFCGTESALVLPEKTAGRYERQGVVLDENRFEWSIFRQSRWLAAESFPEENESENRSGGRMHLDRDSLSLVMLASPSPHHAGIALLLGPRRSGLTYTYQEIERLHLLIDSVAVALAMLDASRRAEKAGQLGALGLISATIAHEIKQPMAALRMFITMLPQQYGDASFRDRFFPVMPKEVARMEEILSQFLRLGRSENRLEPQAFRAGDLVREIVSLVEPKAAECQVELETCLAADDWLFSDPSLVKQALLNLGLNAIQALSQHGTTPKRVTFSTFAMEKKVLISVADTGPGLAADVLGKLFEPFVTTKDDGFGLGLYITKEQVRKSGGEIVARNLPRGGALFELRFDAAQAATASDTVLVAQPS